MHRVPCMPPVLGAGFRSSSRRVRALGSYVGGARPQPQGINASRDVGPFSWGGLGAAAVPLLLVRVEAWLGPGRGRRGGVGHASSKDRGGAEVWCEERQSECGCLGVVGPSVNHFTSPSSDVTWVNVTTAWNATCSYC